MAFAIWTVTMSHICYLSHPKKCFCQIPKSTLNKWVIERYIKNKPTLELLESATTVADKEAISAVALLDADDETLLDMMGDVNLSDHHILHCREQATRLVSKLKQGVV